MPVPPAILYGAHGPGCLKSLGPCNIVLRWVAGTLYVPVPKAQEVYSLSSLSSSKAKSRISARINLLSLRDPDVLRRGHPVGARFSNRGTISIEIAVLRQFRDAGPYQYWMEATSKGRASNSPVGPASLPATVSSLHRWRQLPM